MKENMKDDRHVLEFNSFLLVRESEEQQPCRKVWIVETPDAEDARLFRSYDEAEREHEMQMQSHKEVWADIFASQNASNDDEEEDEYPEESWQDRYNRFYDQFMDRENANNWGQPPYIEGLLYPASNSKQVVYFLKRAVQNDHKQVASGLIACGADPAHAFSSTEEILSFFDGDLSWLPGMPEGPMKDKLKRMQRGKSAFGM
jgi:hypothetical protein